MGNVARHAAERSLPTLGAFTSSLHAERPRAMGWMPVSPDLAPDLLWRTPTAAWRPIAATGDTVNGVERGAHAIQAAECLGWRPM
jgi:hypothetical protein